MQGARGARQIDGCVLYLIASTLLSSWLAMQLVHEAGHCLGTLLTGGRIAKVVLTPTTLSRTDIAYNPHPLAVVWAGPVFGSLAPLGLWLVFAVLRRPRAFLLRFFAGFCLIANGAYIAGGSLARIGDCGEMLRHGSSLWQLWLFGAATVPAGLWLWNGQARYFGLGALGKPVDPGIVFWSLIVCSCLIGFAFAVGGV